MAGRRRTVSNSPVCPHCNASLEQYEDPRACRVIASLEAQIERNAQWQRDILQHFGITFYDAEMARRVAIMKEIFDLREKVKQMEEK